MYFWVPCFPYLNLAVLSRDPFFKESVGARNRTADLLLRKCQIEKQPASRLIASYGKQIQVILPSNAVDPIRHLAFQSPPTKFRTNSQGPSAKFHATHLILSTDAGTDPTPLSAAINQFWQLNGPATQPAQGDGLQGTDMPPPPQRPEGPVQSPLDAPPIAMGQEGRAGPPHAEAKDDETGKGKKNNEEEEEEEDEERSKGKQMGDEDEESGNRGKDSDDETGSGDQDEEQFPEQTYKQTARSLKSASKKALMVWGYEGLVELIDTLTADQLSGIDPLNPELSREELTEIAKISMEGKMKKSDVAILRTTAPVYADDLSDEDNDPQPLSVPLTEHRMELSLRKLIVTVGKQSEATGPFLELLGWFAALLHPDEFIVYPKPFLFRDRGEKDACTIKHLRAFSTFKQFAEYPRQKCSVTLGLAVIWTVKPVTHTIKTWLKSLHVNVVMLFHPPSGAHSCCPKVYVIGEPNIGPVEMRHHMVAGVVSARMRNLLGQKNTRPVWSNRRRPERNDEGHCLALGLEWLVDLVMLGLADLNIRRHENGEIKAINGFCLLQL
ncbi:hypothetical protein B0H13DRAFT_1903831 [Mycena leptocephala]|nr:hypothetical protein B0H13DRAFT_1903831 [Mycena leptocephala]